MAELGGAIDLRRNQPHASDQIGRIVPADPHRRARIEFQHVDGRHLGIQFDFVVDGNPKHRSGLRRGRRADDGPDLGDEAGGRRAQRDRRRLPPAPGLPGCGGGGVSRASSWLSVTMSPSRTSRSVTLEPSWSTPTTASRRGTINPVTRTRSEKQALVDFATMTSALLGVSFSSACGAVLEPVIAAPKNRDGDHRQRRLEIFGEHHRRINPDWYRKIMLPNADNDRG